MEFGLSNGPLILDASTRYWQNFNFAVLSLVLGNALFLATLFKRPSKSIMSNYKRLAIINNQIFLPFNFFYAFVKCFFLFGFFATLVFDLSVLINFTPLFMLLFFVVFFESWKTILLVFRKRSFRILLINFLVIIAFSFALATTSVFNYKKTDVILLENNPIVELPESNFRQYNQPIYLFLKIIKQDKKIVYNLNGQNYDLVGLSTAIVDFNGYYYNQNKTVHILAPYDLPISELKKVERELLYINKNEIVYVTKKPSPQFTSRVNLKGIDKLIFFDSLQAPLQLNPFPKKEFLKNQNIVKVSVGNKYFIKGNEVEEQNLLTIFKSFIDSSTVFHFQYLDDVTYQKYITVYSKYKQAIFELRKKEELVKYNERFPNNEKYQQDQIRLMQKYPTKYFEDYNFDL